MSTKSPNLAKQMGKNVKNFNLDDWRTVVTDILNVGLESKFRQVTNCGLFLKATNNLFLAEASPFDKFFGIGLSITTSPSVLLDKSRWGHNLMGKSLMNLRTKLLQC